MDGKLFARVEVVLDTTPVSKRNSFKCRGCGKRWAPSAARYNFGRYNFCQQCVDGATPPQDMEYETTLRVKFRDPAMESIYKNQLASFPGKVEFFIYVRKDGGVGVDLEFDDKTFFVINPTSRSMKAGMNIGYNIIRQKIECINLNDFGQEDFVILEGDYYLRMHRWDLKPFNIEVENEVDS